MNYRKLNISNVQRDFCRNLESGITNQDYLKLISVPVGHLFDILINDVPDESYKSTINGLDVTVQTGCDPDSVVIECGDYYFEFDLLSKPMFKYGYYRDKVLPDNPDLSDATIAILNTVGDMVTNFGRNINNLYCSWDG